jgi:hypothetical protein
MQGKAMKYGKLMFAVGMASALLPLINGCAATNSALSTQVTQVEYYRIFDIQTTAQRQAIGKAASEGLARNVNSAQQAFPIPSSAEMPDKPGRFRLVNPLEGTRMAALAAAGGQSLGMRIATCEGASWTAQALRNIEGSNQLRLTMCLFPYKAGYHLNMYAIFTKKEGGLMQMSRAMAAAMVGTPEEWTEKTMLDVVRNIRANVPAQVALLEAQPEIAGTPWMDRQGGDIGTTR